MNFNTKDYFCCFRACNAKVTANLRAENRGEKIPPAPIYLRASFQSIILLFACPYIRERNLPIENSKMASSAALRMFPCFGYRAEKRECNLDNNREELWNMSNAILIASGRNRRTSDCYKVFKARFKSKYLGTVIAGHFRRLSVIMLSSYLLAIIPRFGEGKFFDGLTFSAGNNVQFAALSSFLFFWTFFKCSSE